MKTETKIKLVSLQEKNWAKWTNYLSSHQVDEKATYIYNYYYDDYTALSQKVWGINGVKVYKISKANY